jgi:Mn2+/Fe2+ NRAMP family transporter
MEKPSNWLRLIGPGLLVAATGVGAGDLASAGFAGSHLGTAILWAVLVGAFFKFVITEGLMRWQLATGQTLLEGMAHRLGRIPGWLFLPYLLLWSFFVGSALMSACGVTLHAIFPVFENGVTAKIGVYWRVSTV